MRSVALLLCVLAAMSPLLASATPSSSPSAIPASAATGTAPDYAPLAFSGLSLQQAEDDAIAQSPDVEIAQARADATSAALAAARAGFGPSLIAGYASNPQSGATPSSIVTQTALNVGVQATVFAFTQYLPLLYQAEAAYRASQADVATVRRNESIHAAALYFAALRARATLQARREALDLAQAQLQAAQRRFRAGDAPRIDVVRAEVAVAQAQAALENAQASDANAGQALALETAVSVSTIGDPIAGTLPSVPAVAREPETAVQHALGQRAEIVSANENAAAASGGLNAARAGVFPAITLSAGYEHGIDVGQPVKGPTVNASFELPFNATASSRISQASAALTQARAQVRAAERQVTLEVSSAIRTLSAAQRATAASTRARQAAQEELEATAIGYRTGATSSLERTAAAATYAEARLTELSAIYDEALARAVVQLEVGT